MFKTAKNVNWPLIIIVATVFVSATRWIPALMRSEGFEIPTMWLSWWVPVSALLAVGQPIVEAVSIAFALNAYRYMKNDSQKNLMLGLIGGTLVSFVGVLTPNIVASGSSRSVYELLGDWMWFWGISVVLSTVMPVAAVAFGAARMSETAQKTATPQKKEETHLDENPWENVGTNPQLPTETDIPALSPLSKTPVMVKVERGKPAPFVGDFEGLIPEPQTPQVEAPKTDTRIVVNGYEDFLEKASGMNGKTPRTGSQIEKTFKVSRNTAYKWAKRLAQKESNK